MDVDHHHPPVLGTSCHPAPRTQCIQKVSKRLEGRSVCLWPILLLEVTLDLGFSPLEEISIYVHTFNFVFSACHENGYYLVKYIATCKTP
jgi:hypothetical protein